MDIFEEVFGFAIAVIFGAGAVVGAVITALLFWIF